MTEGQAANPNRREKSGDGTRSTGYYREMGRLMSPELERAKSEILRKIFARLKEIPLSNAAVRL
jgi:hypothetical protein